MPDRGMGRARAARRLVVLTAVLAAGSLPPSGAGAAGTPGLPDYLAESDFLAHVPGASTSGAAGLLNPAAWAASGHGSLFVSWDDADEVLAPTSRVGVLGLRNLGFGIRRFDVRDSSGTIAHVSDYTLGLSFGSRARAFGVAYTWIGGRHDLAPRNERLTFGSITRPNRALSVGASYVRDLERSDHYYTADVGFRPRGPRLTLFGDLYWPKERGLFEPRAGLGAEVLPTAGLALAVKARSGGAVTVGLSATLGRALTVSARPHYDDGDHQSTTFAVELGTPGPSLTANRFGGRTYPPLELRGAMAYQRYALFDRRRTLLGTLESISRAAEDPRVGGLVVNLSGARLGLETAWELREQLAGFKAHGKTVTLYFDNATLAPYLLASVADQVWMDPYGMLEFRGVASGLTYYRRALDKLGIGIDELRFFTYKSALEVLSRERMSPADRQQRQDAVDDIYETGTATMTEARGISRTVWEAAIDTAIVLSSVEAQQIGLVDSIGTWDDAKRAAPHVGAARATDAPALVSFTGDPRWEPLEWGEADRIALLYAIGECDMESGIRARLLAREIKEAASERRVKAIVLRADSPGGDPLASDVVARELRQAQRRKPVVVSQGQVAGSGGYWISMYGRPILASPYTITGSIGVIDGWLWNKTFGDKIGLTFDRVKRGRTSDLGRGITIPLVGATLPERALSPDERDRMEMLIRDLYQAFVRSVAEARGMSEARVDSIGQGHFYSGVRGYRLGLVDRLGGLWEGLRVAREAAGLSDRHRVEIDEGPSLGVLNPAVLQPRLLGAAARAAGIVGAPPDEPVAPVGLGPARDLPMTAAIRNFLERVLSAGGRPLLLMEPLELPEILAP